MKYKCPIDCVIGDLDSISNDVRKMIPPDKIIFVDKR